MNKEIIVQSNEDETQVAVLENEQLVEIYIERSVSDRLVGSIFKGRVENVLPGMQAAFVNIGLEKNAFLYVEDALPNGTQLDNGVKLNIRDILKEGQEILVEVVKEPVGNKGPRVTRQLTLPGRFLVLMPNVDYVGISRRISNEEERERLKQIAEKIKPESYGIIVRTVAEGASEEDLKEDLDLLINNWRKILQRERNSGAPALIHKDLELVKRILRDVVTDDVRRITVNSQATYEQIMEIMAGKLKFKINLVEEQDLFSRYNIHQELSKALKRKVWLKSGGYIVIDQTEALTSIDVNTGKYVGSVDLADTVLKINLEAVVEIARQLRLRNICGIIIIEFIDMENEEHRKEVLAKLEEELHRDKTKAHILGITSLGLVEMTRKKTRHSLSTALEKPCPCCEGKGRVLSESTIVIQIKEKLRELAARTMAETILVTAHPDVAALLIGPGGTQLKHLEESLKKEVIIRGRKNLSLEQYEIQSVYGVHDLKNTIIPVEENQIVKVLIEEQHAQHSNDGIGRIEGYIINVENAGKFVGEKVLVEIAKVYRTYAKAVLVQ
ncbi:MAG: Rne/Rng family ribonuclease [Clostridia bacterium]|nr:Rne/Rng family ribonuclease [Clostridia bacterium]